MAWPVSAFPSALDVIVDVVNGVNYPEQNDINGAYDCIKRIEAKVGVDSSAVITSLDYLLKNTASVDPGHSHTSAYVTDPTIPSGTKMMFYQDIAPTGWTLLNTLDDKLLFVTKGSAAGGETGGGVHSTGTWTQPGHNHTGPSHTHTLSSHVHTTSGHVLTEPEMPSHNHISAIVAAQLGFGGESNYLASPGGTGSTGGDQAHDHGNTGGGSEPTGAEGTGSTGDSATAATWRPAAYCVIICSKN